MGWIASQAVGRRWQEIGPPDAPPPGGTPTFGPRPDLGDIALATRAQAVRDGTIPQAVTHPGGSPTVVNPGDNWTTKANAAGTGATLWVTKGTHNLSSYGPVVPLAGQNWILESALGYTRTASDSAIVDGGNGALNALIMSNALNVTIKGGVWQNQGNASSATWAAAIFDNGGLTKGGMLVQDAIVKDNYNVGIKFSAPNCIARRCYVTNNGRYNFNSSESLPGERYTGVIVENCRWSFGNSNLIAPGGNASGSKFVHCTGLIVRKCWVHDNYGFGIWSDYPSSTGGVVYSENVAETNARAGLFLEGVHSGSAAIRNYVLNNGNDVTIGGEAATSNNAMGIHITNSDTTIDGGVRGDVTRNVVDYTLAQSAIKGGLLQVWSHQVHPAPMRNWDIHLNQFWLRDATQTARVSGRDTDPDSQLWANDIDFFDNEYHVASLTNSYWRWGTGTEEPGSVKDWNAWRTFHPGDTARVSI